MLRSDTTETLVTSLIDISDAGAYSTTGCVIPLASFADGARWSCVTCVSWFGADISSVATITRDDSGVADVGSRVPSLNLISLTAVKTGPFIRTLPIVCSPLDRVVGVDLPLTHPPPPSPLRRFRRANH